MTTEFLPSTSALPASANLVPLSNDTTDQTFTWGVAPSGVTGSRGATGPAGATGQQGATGSVGVGVPFVGGATGSLVVTDSLGDLQSGPQSSLVENASQVEINLLAYCTTSNGNGTTDDSTAFQNAINAVNALGGGILRVPAFNLAGVLATWTVGSLAPCVEFCNNLTVMAYGAHFQAYSGGVHTLFGSGVNQGITTALTVANVKWFGGTFVGTGSEGSQQAPFEMYRVADIDICDVTVTNWSTTNGCPIIYILDGQRIRVEHNTILNSGSSTGSAENAICVSTSSNGSNSLPATDVIVRDNIVTGFAQSCILVQISIGSGYSNYANTNPYKAIITGNDCQSTGWNAIGCELTGNATPLGAIQQVIIANNRAECTGASGAGGFYAVMVVDSTSGAAGLSNSVMDILVTDNIIVSAEGGISCQASNALLDGNDITVTGVAATSYGIYIWPPGNSGTISHVHIRGGLVNMPDGGAAHGIYMNDVLDGSIDTDVNFPTGATGSADGVYLNSCTRVDVKARTKLSPASGLVINSCGYIQVVPGTRVYNPSTNATVAGISITGTLTGPVYVIGSQAVDDRGGSAKMTYGLQNAAGTSANVYSVHNMWLGWVTNAVALGSDGLQLQDVVDTRANIVRSGPSANRETWGSAAPSSGLWGVGDKCWDTAPTSNGVAYWVCVSGGTPGTWQPVYLNAAGSGTGTTGPTGATGAQGSQGIVGPTGATGPVVPFTESRTWAIQGTVTTASVPGFFEPVDTGIISKKLVKTRYVTGTGTVNAAIQQNGSNVSGLGLLNVSASAGATSPGSPPSVTDGDYFTMVIAGATGATNLSMSLIFETTQ